MDEDLPIACNNVITPYAEPRHAESASRGCHYDTPRGRQGVVNETRFRQKCGDGLAADPTYNVKRCLRSEAYSRRALARDERERRAGYAVRSA
jgi:hypothetical protein